MRVLSQAEIDAMLAKMLANPSILPDDALNKNDKSAEKNETEEKVNNT